MDDIARAGAMHKIMVAQAEDTAVNGTPDQAIQVMALFPVWAPGVYSQEMLGQARLYNDYPYKLGQAHDSTSNPDWTPEATPALWWPYHGSTVETALPWRKPTGAHDMYKQGEMMVWTDGRVYRCKQDTAYSPDEYAQAWEVVV